ncbi:MAG: tetratricopeptide repeat protein [bacterium]|nr:tetratricopeptide repeat protein [bacterium]
MITRMMLVLALGCALRGWAVSGEELQAFMQAEQAYTATNYPRAIAAYEHALKAGYHAGGVYFNLGNAYYRNGQLGNAITAYQRARRLLPRNSDIAANLATARSQTRDHVWRPEPSPVLRSFFFIYFSFSVDELLWATALLGLLIWVCLSVQAFCPRDWLRTTAVVLATLAGVCALAASVHVYALHNGGQAVVCANNVIARAGTGEAFAELFVLNDGTEVQVLERQPGWLKVLADANKGWIPADDAQVY